MSKVKDCWTCGHNSADANGWNDCGADFGKSDLWIIRTPLDASGMPERNGTHGDCPGWTAKPAAEPEPDDGPIVVEGWEIAPKVEHNQVWARCLNEPSAHATADVDGLSITHALLDELVSCPLLVVERMIAEWRRMQDGGET